MELQPHQQRVIKEREDLEERLNKLNLFIQGDKFKYVDWNEQTRLLLQSKVMEAFSLILQQRIEAFE